MHVTIHAGLALALPLAALGAQDTDAPHGPFAAPVHASARGDAEGHAVLWASAAGYKVGFDDGLAFHPVLGADHPASLPLRWRTASVRVGATEMGGGATTRAHGPWRVEFRSGSAAAAVVERYDLRHDGVEQSFVITPRGPAPEGQLVVEGRVDTPLRAVHAGGHGPVEFLGPDGAVVVRYGAAFAIDAAGRTAPMQTVCDGDRVALVLDEAWLRDAVWPVTVDPLVSNGNALAGGEPPRWPAIARNDEQNQQMVVYSRGLSGADHDVYARILDDDGAYVRGAFTDLDANSSAERPAVTFVGGADRWVIAYERHGSGTVVALYLHDAADPASNSGTAITVPNHGFGSMNQAPCLGGTPGLDTGVNACLVYRTDSGLQPRPDTANSRIYYRIVDAARGTLSTAHWVSEQYFTDIDAEAPTVTPVHAGGPNASWLVAWHEYDNARTNDLWNVVVRRVRQDGSYEGRRVVVADGRRHALWPLVAGSDGRYLMAWTERDESGKPTSDLGERVMVQRLDWPENSATSRVELRQQVAYDPNVRLTTGRARGGLAYDHETRSHWALGWTNTALGGAYCARFGHDGRIVEARTLEVSRTAPASAPVVCFDDDADRFSFAWVGTAASHPVRFAALEYEAATAAAYGSGCAGRLAGRNANGRSAPHAGSEFYELRFSAGTAGAPTVLFAGFAPGALPLPGTVGCGLLLDPALPILEVGRASASATGTAAFGMPFPDGIVHADLHWQVLQLVGSSLATSAGLTTSIR